MVCFSGLSSFFILPVIVWGLSSLLGWEYLLKCPWLFRKQDAPYVQGSLLLSICCNINKMLLLLPLYFNVPNDPFFLMGESQGTSWCPIKSWSKWLGLEEIQWVLLFAFVIELGACFYLGIYDRQFVCFHPAFDLLLYFFFYFLQRNSTAYLRLWTLATVSVGEFTCVTLGLKVSSSSSSFAFVSFSVNEDLAFARFVKQRRPRRRLEYAWIYLHNVPPVQQYPFRRYHRCHCDQYSSGNCLELWQGKENWGE